MDTAVSGRRLSLAISLIAKPKVLYLDEPSTGLDPETRQELWRIVSGLRPGRCVVLTTHSMEEARPTDRLLVCRGVVGCF